MSGTELGAQETSGNKMEKSPAPWAYIHVK